MRAISDLKAGDVGTGFIGVVHVDSLCRLGAEVLGVVGSSPERAAATGVAPVHESYEALLADERLDVVRVATPNNIHFPPTTRPFATATPATFAATPSPSRIANAAGWR